MRHSFIARRSGQSPLEMVVPLPVPELSAEAKERARRALNESLYYVCMAVEVDSHKFIEKLRAAGFVLVELPDV